MASSRQEPDYVAESFAPIPTRPVSSAAGLGGGVGISSLLSAAPQPAPSPLRPPIRHRTPAALARRLLQPAPAAVKLLICLSLDVLSYYSDRIWIKFDVLLAPLSLFLIFSMFGTSLIFLLLGAGSVLEELLGLEVVPVGLIAFAYDLGRCAYENRGRFRVAQMRWVTLLQACRVPDDRIGGVAPMLARNVDPDDCPALDLLDHASLQSMGVADPLTRAGILRAREVARLRHAMLHLQQVQDVQVGACIGTGFYGSVYRGHWGSTEVALKRISLSTSAGSDDERHTDLAGVLHEATVLQELRHPHIVTFFGTFESPLSDGAIYLVLEYMSAGSLLSFLRASRSLSPQTHTHMLMQVARGMCYLASKHVVHRDLAARNILMRAEGTSYTLKVADMGMSVVLAPRSTLPNFPPSPQPQRPASALSSAPPPVHPRESVALGDSANSLLRNRFAPSTASSSPGVAGGIADVDVYRSDRRELPFKWSAPETLKFRQWHLTSDVWSFGVLMYEVLSSGQDPYSDRSVRETIEYVLAGGTLGMPVGTPLELVAIAADCFAWDAQMRPSFEELLRRITVLHQEFRSLRSSSMASPPPLRSAEGQTPQQLPPSAAAVVVAPTDAPSQASPPSLLASSHESFISLVYQNGTDGYSLGASDDPDGEPVVVRQGDGIEVLPAARGHVLRESYTDEGLTDGIRVLTSSYTDHM